MFADDQVCIVFTAGVFTGQTFVLSSEVNHNLRPLIHQLVESEGGTLTAVAEFKIRNSRY